MPSSADGAPLLQITSKDVHLRRRLLVDRLHRPVFAPAVEPERDQLLSGRVHLGPDEARVDDDETFRLRRMSMEDGRRR